MYTRSLPFYIRRFAKRLPFSLALILAFCPLSVFSNTDVYSLDLEQLVNVEVTSVSKKTQTLMKTAAAVHVISQEDIRRSGATSLPEVLRGVPGVQVAQVDANKWAVSIRGFNDRFANKLLVMVDGRSVYSPLLTGVFWNMQDMLLEDIERIEVIRGPGGAIWGANAVNGVINIITKSADQTQGTQITLLGGSQEKNLSARYGGKINDHTSFRLFAKGKHVENFNDTQLHQANDQWRNFLAGFRVDSDFNAHNQWMLQGGYSVGTADQFALTEYISRNGIENQIDYQSGNILFRWENYQSENNKWRFQAYYDHFNRHSLGVSNEVNTLDLDLQNQFKLLDRHDVVWGLGYRAVFDNLESNYIFTFDPQKRYTRTFSAFVQDDIQLSNTVRFTLGSKIEHNSFTGFEFQPNTRLLWEINERNSVWAAASRAVRIPSRSDSDVRVNLETIPSRNPFMPPTLISAFGNKNLNSEKVYAFELGYRSQLSHAFTVDTALFYNYYDDLVDFDVNIVGIEQQPAPAHLLVANNFANRLKASTYGAEIIAKWQATSFWQLISSYTWFELDARLKGTGLSDSIFRKENSDPSHQFSVRSNIQLPYNLELNSMFYYTDRLRAHNVSDQARLDLRLAWSPKPDLELSVVAQNITNKQHQEFTAQDVLNSGIPRSVYGRILLRF
ncbi:iron complex outermembrane recepter protein [Nitrosomonas marina]|uniref:Iron complex outermembrane recepter protein n=1 Tax=Nitrosomonas marina TaxID=917 RepID=A0A1H9Y235_9PROT|nr:TonB-dependent receptor [Nitrosomonas marina]SES62877.1 iron complex outermembrane recepter protein [Nitrosomonas marina]